MLPPVDQAVLRENPDFAALYSTLTTAVLNADGSTKDDHSAAARERVAIREELDGHRLKWAKQHLLAQAVSAVVPSAPKSSADREAQGGMPSSDVAEAEELLELLLLLDPLLTGSEELSPETISLLLSSPPLSCLDALLPDLARLVSSHLQSSAVQLARAANPSTNPSFLHRHISTIPVHINTLSSTAAQQTASLADARLQTANSLVALLEQHNQALLSLVRSLETKHGGVARSLELRGADVALETQRGALDTESALWTVRRDVYSPEVREALRNYAEHVKDGQRRLKEAARTAKMELAAYGVEPEQNEKGANKERRFREVARVHRDLRSQIDEAKRDLDRLR